MIRDANSSAVCCRCYRKKHHGCSWYQFPVRRSTYRAYVPGTLLALVLMTIDILKLAPVAGQMGIILLAQLILMALCLQSFNVFVAVPHYSSCWRHGNCGWGCGFSPNAATTKTSRYGSVWMAPLLGLSDLRSYNRRYLANRFPSSFST